MAKPTPDAHSRAELAAQAWADVCELLDLQLSPLGMRAIHALSPMPGDAVVDVGCGAGQSVLQLAERVGAEGRVSGIDIARRLRAALVDREEHGAVALRNATWIVTARPFARRSAQLR